MSKKGKRSKFLVIKDEIPLIQSLRNYFSIPNFENLTFSENIITSESLPISEIFRELKDKVDYNPKGKKSILWTNPRPGITYGLLSDTILDFIVLEYAPTESKQFLIRNRKSKYYLLKGWKPKTQNNYCEPLYIKESFVNDENYQEKLIQPRVYYRNTEEKYDSIEIQYFIPFRFIQHHISIGPRVLSHGRRIEKKKLVEWGYLLEEKGSYILSEKSRELLHQLQNLFFLEWWRGYFLNEEINDNFIKEQKKRFVNCSEEIILRAYIDTLLITNRISIQKEFSVMNKLLGIDQKQIISYIGNWMIGEYYGKECIYEENFKFPPEIIDRFWASWTIIKNRYHNSLLFLDRQEERDKFNHLLKSNDRVIIIKGDFGIGKTRFMTEVAEENNTNWDFYWLLLNKEISWNTIKQFSSKEKGLVLIIDDTNKFENWELILEEFIQLEISSNKVKLVIVSPLEMEINIFIRNHFKYRNEEVVSQIELKPLNISDTNLKNKLTRSFLEYDIDISTIDPLLLYSEGYPEVIEHEFRNFIKQKEEDKADIVQVISQFDQRIVNSWNNELKDEEKEYLLKLSIMGDIHYNQCLIPEISKELSEAIIKNLIKKEWVVLYNARLYIKRIAYRNWIIEKQWLKKPEMKLRLNKFIEDVLIDNPNQFLKVLIFLYRFLNYVDFKKLLDNMKNWGNSKDYAENNNQLLVIYKLIPFFALNFTQNQLIMQNAPDSAKQENDPSLSQDVPDTIKKLINRLNNNWQTYINKVQIPKLFHTFNYLRYLLFIIQDYTSIIDICEKLIETARKEVFKTNSRLKLIINELYIYKCTIEILINPKNAKEIIKNYLQNENIDQFHKGRLYSFILNILLKNNEKDFKKILSFALKASDLYASSNKRVQFIYHWAYFFPFLKQLFVNKSVFLKIHEEEILNIIKQKIDIAKDWSKELSMIRQYISFELNWIIFDDTSEFQENVKKLRDLGEFALEYDEFYLIGDIFHQIGLEYFKNEYYKEAIENFKKSIKYTKESKVIQRISHTYFYLGDTYWRLGNFNKARAYHKKAYKQYIWEDDKSKALSSLNTLYDIDISTGEYDSAIKVSEEILFLSSELKDSTYYRDAVVRVAEANYLSQNFAEADRRLEEIWSKLDSLEGFMEKDMINHVNLLKLLILFKRKRKIDKKIFEQLSSFLPNYNFLKNSFEFFWILRLIDVLYSKEKKDWINKIVESIKSNNSILDNPLSPYEILLNYIDRFFEISDIPRFDWPQWANYFLQQFEKPEEFLEIGSTAVEAFRNVSEGKIEEKVNEFITAITKILREEHIPKQEKIPSITLKITSIYPILISGHLKDKEIIIQLFKIFKEIHNIFGDYEDLLKKIEFHKTPYELFNIFMILADNSTGIGQIKLTEEILTFTQQDLLNRKDSKDKLEILKRFEELEEGKGNVKAALSYLENIQKILETTGTEEERFATKLKRLNLSLFHSFNEDVEKEIFEWDEESPKLTIKIKNHIKELKIFTLLKKKQFEKAQRNAILLISDRDVRNDIHFLLSFISGFINTARIQEKITDKLLDNKLVDKYLYLLEKVENEDFIINSFEHADALVSLTHDLLKKIEQGREISDSLKRWERVIKILSQNKQVKFKAYLQDLLNYLFKIYLDRTKDNNLKNIDPEIITFLFAISHNYNLINIAMLALNFLIIEAYVVEKKAEFLHWVKIYFQLDYHLKYDEYSNLPEYMKNPPFFIKIGRDLGLEIDKENTQEIYEFNSAFYLLYSTVFLFDLFQKMDYDKWSDHMIVIWLKSIDILKFSVLRKQDNQILTGLWRFLIIEFDMVLSRLYRASLQTDDYKTFNKIVLEFKSLDGWGGILGEIWVNTIGLNGQDVPTRKNRFQQLKIQLLKHIPESLKELIQEQFTLLENLISPYKNPYEIAIKNDVEFCKLNYLKLIETNDINAQVEKILNIINDLSILEDFKGTLEWIKIGKELFTANGRNVELLILQLYKGIVYNRQGNLRDAKEKFKILRNKWRNLNINDFLISTLLYYQIELRQGQDLEQCLEPLNQELYRYFKVANKKEKQYFLEVLLGQMFTEIEPEFFKEIIRYFIKNHKIIISQYNLTVDSFKILIQHYKLGLCVKIKKEKLFLKEYEKFYDENPSEAMQLFYDGPFTQWIDYLKPEEREEFNKNLLEFLLNFYKRKEPAKKIKISITETFKEEIIKQNIQLPPKTLHFIPHNLIRLHPEFFEYSSH